MKKNRLPLIILAVLALVAAVLLAKQKRGTMQSRENNFAVDDTASVNKIFLADKQGKKVTLERLDSGSWQLNGKYEASEPMMEVMLKTICSIAVKEPVAKAARNNIIRVMSGKSVKVEIYQQVYRINLFGKVKLFKHEKRTRTYYVGDATMDNSGTFMLMEGSERPYVVYIPGFKGYVAARYSPLEADWRGHSVFRFKLPEISSVSVAYSEKPENSFIIRHVSDRSFELSALAGNTIISDFDTVKVIQYLSMFRDQNFESVLDNMPKAKYDSITKSTPTIVITLVDKLNKPHVLNAWKRKAEAGQTDMNGDPLQWDMDRLYAKVEGVDEMVTIQYFALGETFLPLSWFLKESRK